jgi:hypothetical protein
MTPLTLEDICKQKIIESIPYNEIKKLPKFLQNKVLTINKIFSFDDSLYTSEYKQSPLSNNYFDYDPPDYDNLYYKYYVDYYG